MSKKLSSVSLAIVSGAAVAVCAASCSSSSPTSPPDGGSSSSSSGGSSSSSGGSSSSSGGSSSSSSGSGGGDASDAGSLFACVGSANSQTLIDDQSAPTGTAIALKATLTPAGCGFTGTWFDYGGTGTITPAMGSFTFSPQPAGLPADSGIAPSDAGVSDGGIAGPRAACISGVTGPTQYSTSGVGFNFATLPAGDAGNPPQVTIDASSHTGVQFWAWGGAGGDAGTQSVIVSLGDKNETPGLGTPGEATGTGTFCDPANGGLTACGAATKTVVLTPGWQFVQVAFAQFADNMYFGGMNETALDPTSLTQLQWQVQQPVADAAAGVPFDFCLYGISFY